MPTPPAGMANWVALLLLATSVPGALRGVFTVVSLAGQGSMIEATPRELVRAGLFALVSGLVTGVLFLVWFGMSSALLWVLVIPGLAVVTGVVCIAGWAVKRGRPAGANGDGEAEAGGGDAGAGSTDAGNDRPDR